MRLPLRYNFRSVLARKTRSLLTAGGVAVSVFVSILMIALTRGVISGTRESGSAENLVVLSKGAESMEFSALDPAILHLIESSQGIRTEDGAALASPEAYLSTFVRFPGGEVEGDRRGVVRGVRPVALRVHDRVRIVAGTPPQRGFEVAVGRLAATKLGVPEDSLTINRAIEFEGQRWNVVGVFDAGGTAFDSEIWADLDDVLVASKRIDYSAIALAAAGRSSAESLLFDLSTRTDVRVDAKTELDYYAALAAALRPVQAVSILMTAMLVAGGTLAGMNTMFTSVLGRSREMGVLLVLGYHRRAVLVSFVVESVALCLAGGIVGAALGSLLNGVAMKIPMGAFRFVADAKTLGIGLGLAVLIGVLGGLVPVLRVARLRTVEALRAE